MHRNRRQSMRSFTWELADGDEVSNCPDCEHWHLFFEVDDDPENTGFITFTVREWHEADCPIWNESD